jgi:hypothetical protein
MLGILPMMHTAVRRPLMASALVYVTTTLIIGRHVIANLASQIVGDRGDPVLNAAILAWNALNIPWTDRWYDFPGFHPATDALTFSEHLLGASPLATPLYWLTQDAVVAYNLTVLASYVLCGLAMFALIWHLTGSAAASFLAGFAYAFAPYRVSQLGHVQVLVAFWMPLALLGLHRFLDTRRRRWLALFGVCWMLQGAANGYFLVFFSLLIGLWVLWFVVLRARWRELGWIALAGLVSSLPLLPILLRFFEVHARYMLSRTLDAVIVHSADVSAVLCAPPGLSAYRDYGGTCRSEGELFPGLALVLLCAAAAAASWRLRGRTRAYRVATAISTVLLAAALVTIAVAASVAKDGPFLQAIGPLQLSASNVTRPFSQGIALLLLAAACSPAVWSAVRRSSVPGFYLLMVPLMWVFTWGPFPLLHGQPALARGPYAWLMLLPGLDGLRVPARFWMMAVICLCIGMGVVMAAALRGRRAVVTWMVAIVGAAGLAADGWTRLPADTLLPSPPRPDLIRGGVALTLPLGSSIALDVAAQLAAVEHGWVSANGYSGYEAPHYARLREASRQDQAGVMAPFLARADLHVIVSDVSPRHVELVERQPRVAFIAAANGLRQYRIPRQGTVPASEPRGEAVRIASVAASCETNKAPLALDGDLTTRWECGLQRAGQQITADVGTVTTVGQVIPALGRYETDYPRRLVVETSTDGVAWSPAWDGDTLVETFEALVRDPRQTRIVIPFTPRPARYVRLRLASEDNTWYWSIAELEVWSGAP